MPDLPPAHTARWGDFIAHRENVETMGIRDAPWWHVGRWRAGLIVAHNPECGPRELDPEDYVVVYRPPDL
jgi:hypothetical protein